MGPATKSRQAGPSATAGETGGGCKAPSVLGEHRGHRRIRPWRRPREGNGGRGSSARDSQTPDRHIPPGAAAAAGQKLVRRCAAPVRRRPRGPGAISATTAATVRQGAPPLAPGGRRRFAAHRAQGAKPPIRAPGTGDIVGTAGRRTKPHLRGLLWLPAAQNWQAGPTVFSPPRRSGE